MSKRKPERKETELYPQLLSTAVMNSFIDRCSSPRAVMDGSHVSSTMNIINGEVKESNFEGIEYELGKYIDDFRTTHDSVIKDIIPKLADKETNPEITIILEYEENGHLMLDLIQIPVVKSNHSKYGYRYHHTDELKEVGMSGEIIKKGTILATTDSYDHEDGIRKFGINANIVNMSHVAVGEDGILFSDRFVEKYGYVIVEKNVINLTRDNFPVNLYGDLDYHKFLPDIGEPVREDGILCSYRIRDRDDSTAVVDLNDEAMMRHDRSFDVPCQVYPGSVVADIKVYKGRTGKPIYSNNMTTQLDKYADIDVRYAENIYNAYTKIRASYRKMYGPNAEPPRTKHMQNVLVRCKVLRDSVDYKRKMSKRGVDIDQYRIEVTTTAIAIPTVGNKFVDLAANKGILCNVIPWQDMPRNVDGVYADIVFDDTSRSSRMNLSGLYAQYIGALARDNRMRLINRMINKHGRGYLDKLTDGDINDIHAYITEMFSYVNPDYHEYLANLSPERKEDYVYECLEKWIYMPMPVSNAFVIEDIIDCLRDTEFAPTRSVLTYKDEFGNEQTTIDESIIGRDYIMLLDKTADEFSSVAAAKMNNFMLPVKGSDFDKRKYPHSQTPIGFPGETESRNLIGNADPRLIAEIFDMSTNPTTLKKTYTHMLECDGWFDENYSVDREHIPYGNGKPVAIVKHIWRGAGVVVDAHVDDYPGGHL